MKKIAQERAKRAADKAEMDAFKPKAKKKYEGPSLQEIMHEATKEGLQYAAYCKKARTPLKRKNSGRFSEKIGRSSLLTLYEVKERTKRKQRFRFWRMRIIAGKKTYT